MNHKIQLFIPGNMVLEIFVWRGWGEQGKSNVIDVMTGGIFGVLL